MKRALSVTAVAAIVVAGAIIVTPYQSSAFSTNIQSINMSQSAPLMLPAVPPMYPNLLQQVPGTIGDFTKEMPKFSEIKPLLEEEVMDKEDSVQTQYGWFADRIRLEDIEQDLLKFWQKVKSEKNWSPQEMRYRVFYKMNFRSVGVGGGVSGGGSAISSDGIRGGFGSGSILPGFNSTLTDPHFIIKIYHIRVGEK